ncbi:transposase [Adhaeribacter aerolatus]|jgi:transposase|uniref:Transposase n=1 Tax=Adhaeribacter aerolatus TaxID=670289 RepID=A0A512B698_9BACT|nr:transposase [Adhaeribacter aerolatus]GEO07496.1 transposase [Adhaeribacter aerolatus]
MKKVRRKFTAAFKAQVALEALKERQTLAALAEKFQLHPNQISQWKQEFMENSQLVFAGAVGKEKEEQVNLEALYAKIGQLEMERDFLKKSLQKSGL